MCEPQPHTPCRSSPTSRCRCSIVLHQIWLERNGAEDRWGKTRTRECVSLTDTIAHTLYRPVADAKSAPSLPAVDSNMSEPGGLSPIPTAPNLRVSDHDDAAPAPRVSQVRMQLTCVSAYVPLTRMGVLYIHTEPSSLYAQGLTCTSRLTWTSARSCCIHASLSWLERAQQPLTACAACCRYKTNKPMFGVLVARCAFPQVPPVDGKRRAPPFLLSNHLTPSSPLPSPR